MKSPRRQWVWAASSALLMTVVALVLLGLRATVGPGRPTAVAPPGREALRAAADFRLPSFDGRMLGPRDFPGQLIVLNFWASWCTPCKQEMPNLERTWRAFRDRGVVVLGINVLDDRREAEAFLTAFQITYPNVHDTEQGRMIAYQVTGLPTTVFIDPQRRIRARFVGSYVGLAGLAELRSQILALLDAGP